MIRPHLVFIDETAVYHQHAAAQRLELHAASAWSAMPRWDYMGIRMTFIAGTAANRRRGSDADQKSHEWRGLPGLHRAMFGPERSSAESIVVVDNVPFHKVAGVEKEAIQAVGASLRYLPPYSPVP